jgi:hypothetical protein
MKPFVLEEALAGAKVMNGQGKPATDIAYFPSAIGVYKVGAVINGGIVLFTEKGYLFHFENRDFTRDLFMAPVKSEGWVNTYKGGKSIGGIHKTEEDARASAVPGLIACVRIEREE